MIKRINRRPAAARRFKIRPVDVPGIVLFVLGEALAIGVIVYTKFIVGA